MSQSFYFLVELLFEKREQELTDELSDVQLHQQQQQEQHFSL